MSGLIRLFVIPAQRLKFKIARFIVYTAINYGGENGKTRSTTITCTTVSIHCAPEMSEIDCIGRIESFWPKFVRGGKYFRMFSYSYICSSAVDLIIIL